MYRNVIKLRSATTASRGRFHSPTATTRSTPKRLTSNERGRVRPPFPLKPQVCELQIRHQFLVGENLCETRACRIQVRETECDQPDQPHRTIPATSTSPLRRRAGTPRRTTHAPLDRAGCPTATIHKSVDFAEPELTGNTSSGHKIRYTRKSGQIVDTSNRGQLDEAAHSPRVRPDRSQPLGRSNERTPPQEPAGTSSRILDKSGVRARSRENPPPR